MPAGSTNGLRDAGSSPTGAAIWLFPVTYVIHLFEEYAMGGGFPWWAQTTLGLGLSTAEFIAWNALALTLMCVACALVSRHRRFRLAEIALAVAVLGNTVAHALGSMATASYSPGLVTGLLLWGPLGTVRLRSAWPAVSRREAAAGLSLGLATILVTLLVLASG